MYRILLISDTHGHIDDINDKISKTQADFVIHAGDFGFYDEGSRCRLSPRELRLRVTHSPFGNKMTKNQSDKELMEMVEQHQLLGNFSDYLSGKKEFIAPVYAVWGNHEDSQVFNRLQSGAAQMKNFHLLDEHHLYEFKHNNQVQFSLFGIGGNFIPSEKLFGKEISDNAGKVWSTLHQFGTLYKKLENKEKPSIFVSHVSPGKESLLTKLMSHFMPNFWISGHMESPFTCVWNQFAIREMNEALDWLKKDLSIIQEKRKLTEEAALACELIKKAVPNVDQWYRHLWNINLPDAKDGYALLIFDKGKFSLETFSHVNMSWK